MAFGNPLFIPTGEQDIRTNDSKFEIGRQLYLHIILLQFLVIIAIPNTQAGSATWKAIPGSSDWNTAANWTPETVPNGPSDVATFGVSSITDITFSGAVEVNAMVFNPGASSYTFTVGIVLYPWQITGTGIANNSGIMQHFITAHSGADIFFENSATAGDLTMFINKFDGSITGFFGNASASNSLIVNEGSKSSGQEGGNLQAQGSTLGNSIVRNDGASVSGGLGGITAIGPSG